MKRQERYQDTEYFHYQNINPKNRITGDCVVRALALGLDQTYMETYKELFELSLATGYMLNDKKNWQKYLEKKGWTKMKQPRKWDNTKYTAQEFIDYILPNIYTFYNVISKVGSHHVTCISKGGQVCDIWDCSYEKIGNYWIKEAK